MKNRTFSIARWTAAAAFGADLVLRRKASLFDLAALVETPASAIIPDFQRLADRQVTANDFYSDDEPF